MSAWKKKLSSQKRNDKLKRKWSKRTNLSSSYKSKWQTIQLEIKMSQQYEQRKKKETETDQKHKNDKQHAH